MRKNLTKVAVAAAVAVSALTVSACDPQPVPAPRAKVTQQDLTPRLKMAVVRDWVVDGSGQYRIVKIESACFVQFTATYTGSLTPIECPKP